MTIDVACAIIFFFGFWHGYSRGIIHTIFNLLTWMFGLTLAFKMSPVMRNILQTIFDTDSDLLVLVAFAINLGFVFFLMRAIAKGIESKVDALDEKVETMAAALNAFIDRVTRKREG